MSTIRISQRSLLAAACLASGLVAAQELQLDSGAHREGWFGTGGFWGSNSAGPWLGPDARDAARLGSNGPLAPTRLRAGDAAALPLPANLTATLAPPQLGILDTARDVDAFGVAGSAGYQLPAGSLAVYGGGGAGLYFSKSNPGTPRSGMAGWREDGDSNLGFHLEAGAYLPVTAGSELGLSVRRLWLRGAPGSPGNTDIGGNFIFFGLRARQ